MLNGASQVRPRLDGLCSCQCEQSLSDPRSSRRAYSCEVAHSFIHQPDTTGFDLRDAFSEFAELSNLESLEIVVAWARRSGMRALRDSVQSMKATGAELSAIIGISQGGTSQQALSEALELFDNTWIFHVPGRTFHPKVYLAKAKKKAVVLVGSHNLTAGGAVNNFEAGVLSRLDLAEPDDLIYYEQIVDFIERLRNDTNVCLKLDDVLLSALSASGSYTLDDEDQPLQPAASTPTNAAQSATASTSPVSLFASSSVQLRLRVHSGRSGAGSALRQVQPPGPSHLGQSAGRSAPSPSGLVRRWFKELGRIDAQQPGSGHRSNTMTLVQAGHDIDHRTYFYETFFKGANWEASETRSGKPRQVATVSFSVIVDGVDMGEHDLEIRHTPLYASGQGNRTTELQWNPSLGSYLSNHSLTGRFVSLEVYANSQYRLIIDKKPSGKFVK